MEKFDKIISLGYICNVAEMLVRLNLRTEAYPFDRVGISAWAVNELLDNDFNEFLEYDNLKTVKLFENSNEIATIDAKYYARLENTELNRAQYQVIYNKMQVRINRLRNVLSNGDGDGDGNTVLFVRSQEPMESRLIPEFHLEKYNKTELEYMVELSKLLKAKYPELKFKILYIGGDAEFNDVENGIVGIPSGPVGYHQRDMGKKMKEHFEKHSNFINKSLVL